VRSAAWTVLLVACGGASVRDVPDLPLHVPDDAERLATELPAGADACVIARPGALPVTSRPLAQRLSAGGRLAWTPAPVAVYAEASQVGSTGRKSVVIRMRVADLDETRTFLSEHAPVEVRFDVPEPACPGPECWRFRAEVVDQDTLLVRRGPWDTGRRGVEAECVLALRDRRDAYEVAVRNPVPLLAELDFESGLPVQVETRLEPREGGVRHVQRVRDDEGAFDFPLLDEDGLPQLDVLATRTRRVRLDDGVVTYTDVAWEDLRLALDDARRMDQAIARERHEAIPQDVEQVDVADPDALREQLELRRAQLAQSGERTDAEPLRRLLERARDETPEDHELAGELHALLLDPLGDGQSAFELAEAVLGDEPYDPREWQLRRRQAAAILGASRLGPLLVEDGVVARRDADAAAEVLARLEAIGDYEWAEGAWVASSALGSRAPRGRPVRRGELPLVSLVETALMLAEDVEHETPSMSVYAVLRTRGVDVGATGPEEARVLTWADGAERVRVGAGATDAPDFLRGLGRGMVDGLEDARVSLMLALVPFGGAPEAPASVVVLEGRVSGERLVVERAAGRGTARTVRDFGAVARLLGEPFAELESRLFPLPDLEV